MTVNIFFHVFACLKNVCRARGLLVQLKAQLRTIFEATFSNREFDRLSAFTVSLLPVTGSQNTHP